MMCKACKQRGKTMSFRTWLPVQADIDGTQLPAEPLHLRGTLCGICGHVELNFDGLPDIFIKRGQEAAKAQRESRKKEAAKPKNVQ